MQYELFYLVGASKEADLDKIKQAATEMITSEGGAFEEKQVTEKRKLAYKIRHEVYGFYVAQRFNLEDTEKLRAINKKLNLYPAILRFLITKSSELPELTSREERKDKESVRPKYEPKKEKMVEIRKSEKIIDTKEVTEAKEKPAHPEKEPKASEEDIDKKLEEILNI